MKTILFPISEWREESEDHWFHYVDGKRTGMWVTEITSLPIHRHRQVNSLMMLTHPFFHIFHSVNDTEYNIGTVYIADVSSLQEAQQLAELYYAKWESVNHNRGEPQH